MTTRSETLKINKEALSSDGISGCVFFSSARCLCCSALRWQWWNIKENASNRILKSPHLVICVQPLSKGFRISGHMNVWYAAGAMRAGLAGSGKHALWRSADLIVRWAEAWLRQQIPTRSTGKTWCEKIVECVVSTFSSLRKIKQKKKQSVYVRRTQESR